VGVILSVCRCGDPDADLRVRARKSVEEKEMKKDPKKTKNDPKPKDNPNKKSTKETPDDKLKARKKESIIKK
jgi:hypothetical protein